MLEEFRLHLLCQVLTASIGDVCILFRYHPCLCMACISLDSFNVAVAELEFERYAEMTQAMKDDRWQPGFLNKGFHLI